jgi:type I restriction-modification system DNA methylase subunit
MATYTCELCDKIFKQKGDYEKHKKRKSACVSLNKLKDITVSGSKLNITTTLNKCLNILRDNCNVLGEDALQIISYFLIMALMENKLDIMDMYNDKYYNFNEDFDEEDKKLLFGVLKFSNLIKAKDDDKSMHLKNLWTVILSQHPTTKDIFKENNSFGINKDDILIELLKTISSINFNNIDSDILGDCYEEVVKNTLLQGDGQFFTPPYIKNVAVSLINIQVNEDGTIETIYDPAMGTGGFILTCIKYIKDIAKTKNIKLNWEQITNSGLGGREVVEKTFRFAKANCLVYSGHLFNTIEMDDTIRVPVIKKYKKIVANPPYGIKGLLYAKIKYQYTKESFIYPTRDEYLPIATNMAVPLFIQAIIYMLELEGECAIVIPNGQELFNNNLDLLNIRIFLMKTCDLKAVIYFPEKQFKKTAIKVCILHFVKKIEGRQVITINKKLNKKEEEDFDKRSYTFTEGHNTSSVKFYNCDQKNGQALLCDVPMDKIAKNNYSLNYTNYLQSADEVYGNGILIKTLGDVCDIDYGTRIVKNNNTEGEYPVYGSGRATFTTNSHNREGCNIIVGRFALSTECVRMTNEKLFLNDSGMSINPKTHLLLHKYIGYYLLHNQNIIYNCARGPAQKNLDIKEFKKIKIPIPQIESQQEAVKYLDFIYEQANKKSQDKINELKSLNEGCLNMQRIFGENVVHTLGDVCEINQGMPLTKIKIIDGVYDVIGGGKIIGKHNQQNRNGDEFTLTRVGDININYIDKPYYLTDNGFSIKSTQENIISKYIYYLLVYREDYLINLYNGAAQKVISKTNLKKLQIPIPSIDRQKNIVEYCEYNDTLIKQLEKEIEQNKQMAQQVMFNITQNNMNNTDIYEINPDTIHISEPEDNSDIQSDIQSDNIISNPEEIIPDDIITEDKPKKRITKKKIINEEPEKEPETKPKKRIAKKKLIQE